MGRRHSTSPSSNAPPRLFCIRATLTILVIALTGASVYFNYSLTSLYSQIQQDATDIQALQKQVEDQKITIDRFNNSITNADVENHVQELEQSLQRTESDMRQSLDQTTSSIQKLLNHTVDRLDQTVTAAQAQIEFEVKIVKSDVEQYARTTQDQFSMENSFMKFQLAGTFCLLAILISMWHMTAHIRQFKRPFVQRKILAILWMSPIYAVTSWLSLVFPSFEGYLGIIKDFYEAYVIYQFLGFCISVLGKGDREKVVELLAHHSDHLDPPMRFFGWFRETQPTIPPRQLASAVLMQCQIYAMQFVFFRPLVSVGLFTCQKTTLCTIPDPANHNHSIVILGIVPLHVLEDPIVWLRIIQNISVFMAFSGLLKFYHAAQDDLAWCNPFPKFLCIKGIVFMTFWQGLVISFLAQTTSNQPPRENVDDDNDPDLWAKQAQNFLICLEMLLFSIAHFYCFPTDEWQDGYQPIMEKRVRGLDNMAFGDFVADLKLIMRGSVQDDGDDGKNSGGDIESGVDKDKKNRSKNENDSQNLTINSVKDDDDDNGNDDKNRGGDIEGGDDKDNNNCSSKNENDSQNLTTDHDKDHNTTDGDDSNPSSNDIEEGVETDKNQAAEDSNKNDPENDVNNERQDQEVLDDSLDEETMDSFLTKSIRDSLAAPNSEVREAAHRLLRDRMIVIDQISERSSSRSGCENSVATSTNTNQSNILGTASDSTYGAVKTADTTVLEYSSMTPMGGGLSVTTDDNINSSAVGETTSLLGNSNTSMGAMNNFG